MAKDRFTVLDLVGLDYKDHNALNLRCIGGRKGLSREITDPYLNRPGLALAGHFEAFAYNRLQIYGRGETAYLKKLEASGSTDAIREMFCYSIPCCIFTHDLEPDADFFREAERAECPILKTPLSTTEFSSRIIRVLSDIFAPRMSTHGVLAEVYGLGVLILGESGVGKSETALQLLMQGHRLVADDVVDIRCFAGNILMGSGANKILGHHMELRGLGIINVTRLFGVGAIREKKQINLVVKLEVWNSEKDYDRMCIDDKYMELLGVNIPVLEIPVQSGRNVPIIIETAAMNERLKKMGYHSAREFNKNILKWIESNNARGMYFGSEDVI
ncbi:MAG: HPr(Ser) kinase/phosphatase [Treponema sp.]|jgi:HPr kinase/phosphorylase|nr:HPr(Ser) kinase/phosphatase [Treponema sp.]